MIQQSNGQGALFELVARGVKDVYFVKDTTDSLFPYDSRYQSSIPHFAERKIMVPMNGTSFGNTFEVEIDKYGDIMTKCNFEIDLPSWFPSLPYQPTGQSQSPSIANGLYSITASSTGESYGYVNSVAYFLFEKIQFYQDQFLIQEWSGDGLWIKNTQEGSYNSSFLSQTQAGLIDSITNPVRALQLRATPGHLSISLPLPGMQCPGDGGFPFIALPRQNYRIKATLRKLEDLIVCSNSTFIKPSPWTIPHFTYTFDDLSTYTFTPLTFIEIGQPTIVLSTIQHYVLPEAQKELCSQHIYIPFRRHFENQFSFGELDYISLDKGGTSLVTRRLDGCHPTEKIYWLFRDTNRFNDNRLDDTTNHYFDINPTTITQPYTYGDFYYTMKLNIAGKDREDALEPFVYHNLSSLVKHQKDNGLIIGTMSWTTGERYGTIYPTERQPEGTINFTKADRPTLSIQLANIPINPRIRQRKCEFKVWTEGWNVYEIYEGRGRLLYSN